MHALIIDIIDTIPTGLLCLFYILVCVLASQAGLFVFNLYFWDKEPIHSNEVTGIVFGAISLIYSLILAFVIVAVWENYEELNKTIASEADKLNSIMAHSATLPDSLQQPMKTAMISYCNQVVNKEWRMEHSNEADQPSAIPELRLMLLRLEPRSKSEESIYNVLDEDLSSLSDLRRNRLSHNRSQVPDLVWLILKAGSVMLIIFSYFFNVQSLKQKSIYLTFLSGYIAMCMFLVYTLDHPFIGNVQVSRQPYTNILMSLRQYYAITQK